MSMLSRLASLGGVKPRPTFVAVGTTNTSGSGTVTINKPTGLQVGDLMVVFLSAINNNGVTWTQLTGWTEVLDSASSGPSQDIQWKIATSADVASSTFTFTSSSGGSGYTGSIAAYRSASFDVVGAATRTTNGSVTASAITVSGDNSVLIGAFIQSNNGATITTAPSGMSQISYSSVAGGTLALYSQDVGAGSSGTKSIGFSGGASSSAVLCSIKPT